MLELTVLELSHIHSKHTRVFKYLMIRLQMTNDTLRHANLASTFLPTALAFNILLSMNILIRDAYTIRGAMHLSINKHEIAFW